MSELDDHIKSALLKENDFQLPVNFSNRIVELVTLKEKHERKWELTGIITAGTLLVVALIITLLSIDFKMSMGALTFLSDHIGLIVFGAAFIMLLNLLDKKIVRKHQVS